MSSWQLPTINLFPVPVGPLQQIILRNIKQGSILKLVNDSQFDLEMSAPSGWHDHLSAGEVNIFPLGINDIVVNFIKDNNLSSQVWPTANLYIVVYDPDTPPKGTYPFYLVRSINIGGTLSSLTIQGLNTWLISQDAIGNLFFQNETNGATFYITPAGDIFFGDLVSGTGHAVLSYTNGTTELLLATPGIGAANGMDFQTFDGTSLIVPLQLGVSNPPAGIVRGLAINNSGHIFGTGTTPTLGALQTGISAQSIVGTDIAGQIHITTTAAPPTVSNPIAILNFNQFYNNGLVFLQPIGFPSSNFYFSSIVGTGFTTNTNVNLTANFDYFIQYFAIAKGP